MEASSFDWLNLHGKNGETSPLNNDVEPINRGSSSPAPLVSFGMNQIDNEMVKHDNINRFETNSLPQFNQRQNNHHHQQQLFNKTDSPVPLFHFEDMSRNNQFYRSNSTDQVNSLPQSRSDLRYNSDNMFNRNHRDFFKEGNNDSLESFVSSDEEDSSIPLSLTAQELTLQESKTYMRWYSDILARTNSRTISLNDVFQFLHNFKISNYIKDKIKKLFNKIVSSINIGEFFALLRLISHTILGQEPKRKLIKYKAPVPCPPSILSKKRQNDDVDDDNDDDTNNANSNYGGNSSNLDDQNGKPLDLDGFTKFLLTGERPDDPPKKKKSKKLKSVKFLDQVVTDVHDASFISPSTSPRPPEIDYSLPMDQLLDRMKNQSQSLQEESEVLKDMESQINHFKNLNSVDSASIGGLPASLHSMHSSEHLLQPNMTGPSQMAQLQTTNYQNEEFLKPNMTGPAQMAHYYNLNTRAENNLSPLQPNITGPADMAKLFAPPDSDSDHTPKVSLQSLTSQMTGNTLANTMQNARINHQPDSRAHSGSFSERQPMPPPVPSRRLRSASSPINSVYDDQVQLPVRNGHTLPSRSPIGNSLENTARVPPPPPPSRRRQTSLLNNQPPQLPPKVEINYNNSTHLDKNTNDFNNQQYFNLPTETNNNQFTHPSDNFNYNQQDSSINNSFYANNGSSDSTANILDDLKALQEEVDKIRSMTGGF